MEDEHKSHTDCSLIDEQRRYIGSFALQFEDAQFDEITTKGDAEDGHEEDSEKEGRIGPRTRAVTNSYPGMIECCMQPCRFAGCNRVGLLVDREIDFINQKW